MSADEASEANGEKVEKLEDEELVENVVPAEENGNKTNGHHSNGHHVNVQQGNGQQTTGKFANINQFEILKHIGSGAYGEVAACRKIVGADKGTIYAMKVMEKRHMIRHVDMVEHEYSLLTTIDNPLLTTMAYSFQTDRNIVFIMSFCGGGDMLTKLEAGCFEEPDAKFYICELIEALGYLHSRFIVHRDVKLENMLIANDGHLKVTDYGLCATNCTHDEAIQGLIGTRHTMAPEIHLGKKYGWAVDWWAAGITYCDMRSPKPVFDGEDNKEYCENTVKKRPKFAKIMSERERSFVNRLIVREPSARLGFGPNGVTHVKNHNFFKDIVWEDVLAKKMAPPYRPSEEELDKYTCFPAHAIKSKFPTFEPGHSMSWQNVNYTAPYLIEQ